MINPNFDCQEIANKVFRRMYKQAICADQSKTIKDKMKCPSMQKKIFMRRWGKYTQKNPAKHKNLAGMYWNTLTFRGLDF